MSQAVQPEPQGGPDSYDLIGILALRFMQHSQDGVDAIDNLLLAVACIERGVAPTPLLQAVAEYTQDRLSALCPALLDSEDPMTTWGALNVQGFSALVEDAELFFVDLATAHADDPATLWLAAEDDPDAAMRRPWSEAFALNLLARLLAILSSGAWVAMRERTGGDPEAMAKAIIMGAQPLVHREVEHDEDGEWVTMQYLDGWMSLGTANPAAVVVHRQQPSERTYTAIQVIADLERGTYEGAEGVKFDPNQQRLAVLIQPLIY